MPRPGIDHVATVPSEAPQPPAKATRAKRATPAAQAHTVAPREALRTAFGKARVPPRPPDLNVALRTRLAKELKDQGYFLETFDPDFVVGVFIGFLSDNDAVLTPTGVRRFKRDRR
jgi:hypothetical protein